tara:strand:+ start:243 stop:914 length:672 start_codon:yes stop_codon:yes gene_type:complete
MHQRKGKNIIVYIFLLILFGSINNLSLNNYKNQEIKQINISGLNESDNKILLKQIKNLNLENIFFLNGKEILKIIEANSLVENYKIFKKYPSTLDIKVEKTIFLAKISIHNQELIIGSNGKLSKSNFSTQDLPYIFGSPSIKEFLNFKKIIDNSELQYNNIKSFYYYQSKRWDIKLKNNTIIKLPRNNSKISLNDALLFLNDNNFKNVNVVDARIENQIIIND